jgi:ABC-type cobalamin/Fe3+-siderophores transport system ATPase subunit
VACRTGVPKCRATNFSQKANQAVIVHRYSFRFATEVTRILGPGGSGKTSLNQKLVLEDLAKSDPSGMVFIDPKGLMVERLQSLDAFRHFIRSGANDMLRSEK